MTKHITLFDTTAEYNNASLDLPNVSYTQDDLKVHYNPYPTYPTPGLNDSDQITQYIFDYFTNVEGITLVVDTPLYHQISQEDNIDQWSMTAHDEQDNLSRFEIYYEPSDGSITFYTI